MFVKQNETVLCHFFHSFSHIKATKIKHHENEIKRMVNSAIEMSSHLDKSFSTLKRQNVFPGRSF